MPAEVDRDHGVAVAQRRHLALPEGAVAGPAVDQKDRRTGAGPVVPQGDALVRQKWHARSYRADAHAARSAWFRRPISGAKQATMANEQDRVREEWRAVAGGWRRWEPLFQSFTWPLALRMVAAAQIGEGQRVLDVGCGIGDPTLQIAVLVGPHGHVLGIDLVEDMLVTARERAAALGLAHVEFQAADVSTLDLPAGTLDAVLGR